MALPLSVSSTSALHPQKTTAAPTHATSTDYGAAAPQLELEQHPLQRSAVVSSRSQSEGADSNFVPSINPGRTLLSLFLLRVRRVNKPINLNYSILSNNNFINYAINYSIIVLFCTLGASLLISCSDLISMYLSIELQSFGLYILATLFRDSKLATSAGLKYFLLGGLSSCLILLGAGLVYTFTGLTNLESIYSLVSVSHSTNITQGLTLGFVLITVGFLFKIAAAPLHHWAPDVYDDSPTIVTIWLTIMPKIAILIFLLEIFIGGIGVNINTNSFLQSTQDYLTLSSVSAEGTGGYGSGDVLTNLLLLSSLLSFLIGTVLGLVQSRIKRLLAYSTISHVGFILLALAVNTEQSIESFIFYIVQYTITNLNTFLIILALGYLINYSFSNFSFSPNTISHNSGEKDIRFISELTGQFMSNPLLSLSLSICLFSMAGIPPLIGFFSKQMVLYSAIQSGYYFMAIVAILVSVISASYYLKIVRVLFSEPAIVNNETEVSHSVTSSSVVSPVNSIDSADRGGEILYLHSLDSNGSDKIIESGSVNVVIITGEHVLTSLHSLLISTLTLSILLFILKPSLLLNSTQLLSLSLYNF